MALHLAMVGKAPHRFEMALGHNGYIAISAVYPGHIDICLVGNTTDRESLVVDAIAYKSVCGPLYRFDVDKWRKNNARDNRLSSTQKEIGYL